MKRIHRLEIVVFLLFFLVGCQGKELSDIEYMKEAEHLLRKQENKSALIALKNAAKVNPSNAEARLMLGKLYLVLGDYKGAEKELGRAIELGTPEETVILPLMQALVRLQKYQPMLDMTYDRGKLTPGDLADVLALRGQALLWAGHIDDSQTEIAAALDLASNSSEALIAKSLFLKQQKKFDEAISWLERGLKTHVDSDVGWALLAEMQRLIGRFRESEISYTKAIEFTPFKDPQLFFWRGLVRFHIQDPSGSEKDAEFLNKVFPRFAGGYYLKAMASIFNNDNVAALEQFKEAARLDPRFEDVDYFLAYLYLAEDKAGMAEDHAQRFFYANPGLPEAILMLAKVKHVAGDAAEAERLLKAIGPSAIKSDADRMLARSLITQGKGTEAVDLISEFSDESSSAYLKYLLGMAFLSKGEDQKAIIEFQKALSLDDKIIQTHIALITTYQKNNEFEKAIKASENLSVLAPDNAAPYAYMGDAYLGLNDKIRAKELFNKALELNPGHPQSSYQLAALAIAEGDRTSAAKLYADVLARYPNDLGTLMRLARLDGERDYIKGNQWLERAISAHPDALQPRLYLARYYLRKGAPQESLRVFDSLDQRLTDNADVLSVKGRAYMQMGLGTEAVDVFEKMANIRSASASASASASDHYLLGQAYMLDGQDNKAIAAFKKVLGIDPSYAQPRVMLYRLLVKQKDYRQAEEIVREELKTAGDNHRLIAMLGDIYSEEKRYDEALSYFEKANLLQPSSEYVIKTALIKQRTQGYSASVSDLERWLTTNPNDIEVLILLADFYLMSKQETASIDLYEKVLRLDPDNVRALNNLAWQYRDSAPSVALDYSSRAVELAPDVDTFIHTQGVVYLNLYSYKDALSVFRKLSKKYPGDRQLALLLARALIGVGETGEATNVLQVVLAEEGDFDGKEKARELLNTLN